MHPPKAYLTATLPPKAKLALDEMEALVTSCKAAEAEAKAAAEQRFEDWLPKKRAGLFKDFEAWALVKPGALVSAEGSEFVPEADGSVGVVGPVDTQHAPFRRRKGAQKCRCTRSNTLI